MCCCYQALKGIREATGNDALWVYDPGQGSTNTARYAIHGQGPAPSLSSFVAFTDITGTVGAILDRDGYITAVLSASGLTPTVIRAAWNGSSTAWVSSGSSGLDWRAYNLSGTLQGTATVSDSTTVNRYSCACDSSGNLVAYNVFTNKLERWAPAGTLVSSVTLSLVGLGAVPLCVDGSDNIIVINGSVIDKYDTSMSRTMRVSYPFGVTPIALVADSGGNFFMVGHQGNTARLYRYTSSGTLDWTVTLSYQALSDTFKDLWCDGSNVYLAYYRSFIGTYRQKYNSSGSQVWSDTVWFDDNNLRTINSIRGDGSVVVYAGARGG